MAPTIKTPAPGFTGVVVGVNFTNGVGETEDPSAVQYFERHGYCIEHAPAVVEPPAASPAGAPGDTPPPASEGTTTEAQTDTPPPADNAHVAPGSELFPPAGNASTEEWAAYAAQQGHNVEGLGRDAIRALFAAAE